MNITKELSLDDILEMNPEFMRIFKQHGVDVDNHCLYSVRHLPIKECPDLCGLEGIDQLLEKLNEIETSSLSTRTVGELVAHNPIRAQVFDQLGIDFCCGGKVSLEEACRKKNLDVDDVVSKLQDCDSQFGTSESTWVGSSAAALVDHIETTHHQYLKKELPRLQALAEKVARVHGERAPHMVQLAKVFSRLKDEIEAHTMKEEMVLFPYIRELEKNVACHTPPFGTVANPINCMESEHDDAGRALFEMRKLTNDYTPPEDACGSWKALLGGLAHFDKDLRTHIHKESSILFPQAILLEESQCSTGAVKQSG